MSAPTPDRRLRALPALADEIRQEIERAETAWRDAVGHAVRAGELLIEAKSQVPHGRWLAWLDANFPGSVRSAQGYMRLARNAEDAQALAHLGVEGALKQLAAPRGSSDEPELPLGHGADELKRMGVRFGPTGLQLPDDLPFEDWVKIGRLLSGMVDAETSDELEPLLAEFESGLDSRLDPLMRAEYYVRLADEKVAAAAEELRAAAKQERERGHYALAAAAERRAAIIFADLAGLYIPSDGVRDEFKRAVQETYGGGS